MDQGTLVEMQIEDGQLLIDRLAEDGVAVTAAFWAKESESGVRPPPVNSLQAARTITSDADSHAKAWRVRDCIEHSEIEGTHALWANSVPQLHKSSPIIRIRGSHDAARTSARCSRGVYRLFVRHVTCSMSEVGDTILANERQARP